MSAGVTTSEVHFAQVREDGEIERGIVSRGGVRKIAVVASGGCTALSLLEDDVREVIAIDQSPAQCALVELRRAALKALDRDGYLRFTGIEPCEGRSETYERLRRDLSPASREHWDARGNDVASGVHYAGTTERFYRFVGQNVREVVASETLLRSWLSSETVADQLLVYEQAIGRDAFRVALRVLLSKTTHLAFFPPAMFARANEASFGDYFLSRLEELLSRAPLRDNYFLHQVLFGAYPRGRADGMPRHLTHEGYEVARRNASKLRIVCAPLAAALEAEQGVDLVGLSNVVDWASAEDAEHLGRSVRRAAAPGAWVVSRHMLGRAALPSSLAEVLVPEGDTSAWAEVDRSALYRAIFVGRMR